MASVDMSPSKNFMERFKHSASSDGKKKKKHMFAKKNSSNSKGKGMKIFGKMKEDAEDSED